VPFWTHQIIYKHKYANIPVDKNPALLLSNPINISFIKGINGLSKNPFDKFPIILYKLECTLAKSKVEK